jgi:pyridoxal biosynthesis lyase PdxS
MIKDIIAAVTIPVMAKTRIGHFAEAQILEALGVDMVDESEGIYFFLSLYFIYFHIFFEEI